jgi:hypothetical protein
MKIQHSTRNDNVQEVSSSDKPLQQTLRLEELDLTLKTQNLIAYLLLIEREVYLHIEI